MKKIIGIIVLIILTSFCFAQEDTDIFDTEKHAYDSAVLTATTNEKSTEVTDSSIIQDIQNNNIVKDAIASCTQNEMKMLVLNTGFVLSRKSYFVFIYQGETLQIWVFE